MIDFKVGDKVKRVKDVERFISHGGSIICVVSAVDVDGAIRLEGVGHWFESCMFELVDDWSMYNNTKQLSELSYEQRGLLFNHWCNDGDIEIFGDSSWHPWKYISDIHEVYRAKQKTEREVFIDEWSSKITTNEYNGGSVRLLVGQMFDDLNMDKEK